MEKIGIITLFGYNNYGNRLQMYAVQKVYKALGYDSEIIKYQQEIPKDPLIIRLKVLAAFILSLKSNVVILSLKNRRVSNFRQHAKLHYHESKEYVNPLAVPVNFHENYSFLSVGSDQIWGWFTHSISKFVFLQFAPVEKRITFSPSFGSSVIEDQYRNIFAQGLNGFDTISVRESSGAQIVKDITNKEATVICDPTMCLSKTEWLQFASPHIKKPKGKYILTYFLGEKSPQVINMIADLSDEFEIIDLNDLKSPQFYAINPSEWVDYINDASLFLTDSFHGIVFSIVLQTPFAVYSRVGGESMHTRITNILEKFNMENRFEAMSTDSSLFKIDFKPSEEIIISEKSKSFDFLRNSLHK